MTLVSYPHYLTNLDDFFFAKLSPSSAQLNCAEAPHLTQKSSFERGRKHKLHYNNQDKHIFALGGLALLAKLVLSLAQLIPSLFYS